MIVIDVQNDFIAGSLALKNGPAGQDGVEVVKPINEVSRELTACLKPKCSCTIATSFLSFFNWSFFRKRTEHGPIRND